MAAEDFFARWSKKAVPADAPAAAAPVVPVAPAEPVAPPTLEDAEALTMASDFTPFVARGIDEAVKRLALKKLFADPHFNIMDGLDTYIEDYNTFVPMTAEMVSELNHAKLLMNPLAHLEQPFMQMLETPPVVAEAAADAVAGESPTQLEAGEEGGEPDATLVEIPVDDVIAAEAAVVDDAKPVVGEADGLVMPEPSAPLPDRP